MRPSSTRACWISWRPEASGYAGGYTRVTDFIRAWRSDAGGSGKRVKAFVPLKFELDEAFHFDWSEDGLVVGGTVP